jgi:hypothetical protein
MSTPSEIELHVRWEHSLDRILRGREGKYRVIRQGKRNGGPGPDFLGAILAFPDGSVHRGDVEIHRNRNDWFYHKHQWDPRYWGVILHVIATGSLKSVPSGPMRAIPTAYIAQDSNIPIAFCSEVPTPLHTSSDSADFILIMAQQRWWRRLSEFHVTQEQIILEFLAHRLGPEGRKFSVMNIWLSRINSESDMYSFLSQVHEDMSIKGEPSSIRRFLGRVMLTSALAYLFQQDRLYAWNQSLEDIKQVVTELETSGFPSPTEPFIIEITGNWLLPLCQVRGDRDRFEEWYQLPLGWKYGRVTKQARRLGIDLPANFGQQQGILEWMESLCQPLECNCCPVAGVLGDI